MKILCPTDFSSAATNGIEYAAKFSQKMNASLVLLNVQRLYYHEGITMFAGGELESVHEAKISSKMLDDICNDINKMFKVSCSHEVISTMGRYANAIADEANDYNLTVIGTNGVDNTYEFYFGSHSFHVAKNTYSPTLIVPLKCSYKEINNVVFASDYNKGEDLLLQQLKEFTGAFQTKLHVLHISKKDSQVGKEIYHSFRNLTEEVLNYDSNIEFHRIISDDPAYAIEDYMHESNADLLATCMIPHGILYRMFHENLIKKITSYCDYPVMIFHK